MPHRCEGAAATPHPGEDPRRLDRSEADAQARLDARERHRAHANAYDYYGEQKVEGVTELSWTGDLPEAYYDEFVFRAMLTDSLAPGSELYFPIVQECGDVAERWIEIRSAGQDADTLEFPAPGVKLLPAARGH